MSKSNRPISPHLTIYKPQITSLLSISHRITGVIQSFGLLLFFIFIFLIISKSNLAVGINLLLASYIAKFFFISYTFSLIYHILNGIRHIIWDLGYCFEIKNVSYSGYAIIFFSVFLNLLLWIL